MSIDENQSVKKVDPSTQKSNSSPTSQTGKNSTNTSSNTSGSAKGSGRNTDGLRKVVSNKDGKKGTSRDTSKPKDKDDGTKDLKKTAKNVKRGAAVGNAGVKGYAMYQLANYIAMMLKQLMAMVKAAGALAQGIFSSIVGAVSSAISAVASFVGAGISAAASTFVASVMVITTAVGGVAAGGVLLYNNTAGNITKLDDDVNCKLDVDAARDGMSDKTNYSQLKVASQIYSVFHELGFPDEQISGILGNFTAESGLDPSCIEGIYNEPFKIGPRKKKAMANFPEFCHSYLFPAYDRNGTNYNPNNYYSKFSDGHKEHWPGIGLGQWTGGTTNVALFTFAKANNLQWYETKNQLAYMLAADTRSDRRKWLLNEWKHKSVTPEQAWWDFTVKWEGNRKNGLDARRTATNKWYRKIKAGELKLDTAYANDIIALAKTAITDADMLGLTQQMEECKTEMGYDASTFVNALLSYAYPDWHEGIGNDGTDLYQKVKRYIFPNDGIFQSCDRSVSTAVRWSGLDITFPIGAVYDINQYLQTTDKWEKVDWGGDTKKLQPGDVIIKKDSNTSHVLAWVGEEAIKKKNGSKSPAGANTVSGSIGGPARSPGCAPLSNFEKSFDAYRCVKPDNSDKYKGAGD